MEESEHGNPIYGRKVFFLNPPYSIKKTVLGRLQEMEYEIYIIDDYHDAKNILRHFPDSICFINVDERLTPEAWFNFVTSFDTDKSLKSIFLGIITESLRKADRDQFLLKANIPAGLIPLNGKIDDITNTLRGILEINGAKGRRQYIRAQCASDKNAIMYYTVGDKLYQMKLIDISSVGMVAILPFQFRTLVQPNSVMRNITISLNNKNIVLNAAVYGIKKNAQFLMLVLFFIKGTPASVKTSIREYIFKFLDANMISSIIGEAIDSTDYNIKPVAKVEDADDAFLLDIDSTELLDETVHIPPVYDGSTKDLTVTDLF